MKYLYTISLCLIFVVSGFIFNTNTVEAQTADAACSGGGDDFYKYNQPCSFQQGISKISGKCQNKDLGNSQSKLTCRAGLTSPCFGDTCEKGLACIYGFCSRPRGNKTLGQSCSGNECKVGLECRGEKCVKESTTTQPPTKTTPTPTQTPTKTTPTPTQTPTKPTPTKPPTNNPTTTPTLNPAPISGDNVPTDNGNTETTTGGGTNPTGLLDGLNFFKNANSGLNTGGTLIGYVANIIRWILGILGTVFFIIIVIQGFLYMTAGGDSSKTVKAIGAITNAVVGLLIIMGAFLITNFVTSALLATG